MAAVLLIVVGSVSAIGLYQVRSSSAATTIFLPSSFWNTPIPTDAPINPNSSAYAANLKRQVTQYYNSANVNTRDYAASVYIAPQGAPTQKVGFNDCQSKGYTPTGLLEQWTAVPIPANAVTAGGTDKEMVIYQPSTDTMWEFWKMDKWSTGWVACWGGKMTNVSKSNGIWNHPYGTTATGLPFIGGQISIAEARAGSIDHAIGMSLVEVQAGRHSWPANRNDGWVNDSLAIPEGLRFRLDPSVNVETLNLPTYGKMMARAMQKYGVVIWDKAGSVSFRGENPTPYIQAGEPDPYIQLFEGKAGYQILGSSTFPWEKMQALPFDYGKDLATTPPPAPTPTPTPTPATISQTNNLATNKVFTSSTASLSADFNLSKTNDRDETTRWISAPADNVSFSTDLGAAYTLNKISILWAGDTTRTYDIQLSGDNTTWKTVASGTTNNSSPQLIDTTSFMSAPAGRYIRIVAKDRWNTTYGNSIWEIGIYGTAAGTVGAPTAGESTTVVGVGGKCLDASNAGTINGTQMIMWTCYNSPNQMFTLTTTGEIRPQHASSMCLDVNGGAITDGTKIQLWTCNGSGAQQWRYDTTTSEFKNTNGKCLDVAGGNTTDGTLTQLYTCNASNAQKWSLPALATAPSPVTPSAPGDANKDGRVNALDLSLLLTYDGQIFAAGDFNGDGTVGAADLAILLSKWTW